MVPAATDSQGIALQEAVHDVQADLAVVRVVEGGRCGADDREAEGCPQVHGGGVGIDHGVELDGRETGRAAPVQYVLAEGTAGALALPARIYQERRGRHMRPAEFGLGDPPLAEPVKSGPPP